MDQADHSRAMRRLLVMATAMVVTVSGCCRSNGGSTARDASTTIGGAAPVVSNEYLVVIDAGADLAKTTEAWQAVAPKVETIGQSAVRLLHVTVKPGTPPAEARTLLKNTPGVLAVEPNQALQPLPRSGIGQ